MYKFVLKRFIRSINMARVTIEDCIPHVTNRFELVLVAAQRARDIISGVPTLVESANDKAEVIALREMAAGLLDSKVLVDAIIKKYQKFQSFEAEDSFDSANESSDLLADDSEGTMGANEVITNMYAVESCEDDLSEVISEEEKV